jgi:pimeloyl-ACP methyl ester carboxylesterase
MSTPYPIVYIRGYAMSSDAIEDTFNKPYYGFNIGSTQVKLATDKGSTMRIFESPVVRLIKDENYVDSFNRFVDNQNHPIKNSIPTKGKDFWRKTLWTFRFYDEESQLLREKERGEIEDYAEDLAIFLDGVKKACGSPPYFKVNLVAHSMGGLIARCYLQNTKLFNERDSLKSIKPVEVNKLFTYGTPHGGITFRRGLGWVEDVRDLLGINGADTFGEERMRKFLSLKNGDKDLRTFRAARGDIDESRIYCLVGSNYKDYVVWVSKKAVGPGSDGLVAMENAYVKNASRAYLHLAHSGPFGIVNSEEGYQNLTRFLFGDLRYEVILEPIKITRDLPNLAENDRLEYMLIDTNVVIRGLSTYLQIRNESNHSSIISKMQSSNSRRLSRQFPAEHLYTGFLRSSAKMSGKTKDKKIDLFMRGAVDIRIEPHYLHDGWIRDSRFEGEAMLNDRLHLAFRLQKEEASKVMYKWNDMDDYILHQPDSDGSYIFPLPEKSNKFLECEGVRIRISSWN